MRKRIIVITLGLSLLLSGCSSINHALEQKMAKQAGISADGNYQTYQEYSQAGKLTEQGYYSQDVFEADLHLVLSGLQSCAAAYLHLIDSSRYVRKKYMLT